MARINLTKNQIRNPAKHSARDAIFAKLAEHDAALDAIEAATLGVYKAPCRVATVADIPVLGLASVIIDGVTLVQNDRVLVKDQTSGALNGIYVVGTVNLGIAALTRAVDMNVSAEVKAGMIVPVTEGTVNGDVEFKLTTNDPIVLGTTALVFALV